MTYQDDEFILVGNFGRPIGLKGSLKLNSFTRPADNIKKYSSFFFKKEDSFISLDLEKITKSGKNLIIFIKDCGSLETAELIYKGKEIYILRSDIPRQKNKFFWNDLIGLEVIVKSSQKSLGHVDSLMETGSNDVLVIKKPGKEDILIPFIMNQVVIEVTEKSIFIDWEE